MQDINWRNPSSRWDFIKTREREVQEQYTHQFREWYLDVAYFLGFQNLINDRALRTVREPKKPSWRIRSVANMLMPMARQGVAQMSRIEPAWGVLPATTDSEDQQIAKLSTNVLHHYWQHLRIYVKYVKTLFWTYTTGTGIFKLVWDSDSGPEMTVGEDQRDAIDAFFQEIGIAPSERRERKTFNLGDMEAEALSPFEIMFADVDDVEKSPYSIQIKIMDDYEARTMFGRKAKDLSPESSLTSSGVTFLSNLNSLTGSYEKPRQTSHKSKRVIYDVHVKPHRQLKTGLRFVMAQGKDLITPTKFPYQHGMLPYAVFPEVPQPGQIFGTSTLHQNRPNQSILNRLDSQVLEYTNLMLKGKWLVPLNAQIKEITDAPGQTLRYQWPLKPEQARLQTFPRTVFDLRNTIKQSMEDTSSNHDALQGRASAAVRSGVLAESLKESDLTVLGPTQIIHDDSLSRIGKMCLQNAAQFVRENRLFNITRGDKIVLSGQFVGSDLVGATSGVGINYFNVITTTTGRAPWSKALQREMISSLVQGGFLRPGEHDQLVHRAVGLETSEVIFKRADLARSAQIQESKLLNQGQPLTPKRQDDHAVHLEVMNEEDEDLIFWNSLSPEAQQARKVHRDMHEQMSAAQQLLPEILRRKAAVDLARQFGLFTGEELDVAGSRNGKQGRA